MKTISRLGALVCAFFACAPLAFAQAAQPVCTPAAGTYASTQSVSCSTTTSAADMFYTLDGSTPTPESTKYTGPITVNATKTLKIIAAVAGVRRNNIQNDSPTAAGTYWKAADYSDAGGSGTPTGVTHISGVASPSLSGASMEFAFTGQTGKQTNVLFAVSGAFGKCDSCTYRLYDYSVYDDALSCTANATTEQDVYKFAASLGERDMGGSQWRRGTGGCASGHQCLDIGGNNNTGVSGGSTWVNSGVSTTLFTCGAWHHFQRAEHTVPAEATTKPCVDRNGVHWPYLYEDYFIIDGTRFDNSGAGWKYCVNALPGGWSSVDGPQHQGDVSSAGGTWKEYIDNANYVSYFPASSVTTAAYTITGGTGTPTAATPTIAPGGGFQSAAISVTLADSTPGAAIHYTTDGTNPTCSSSTYSTAIAVSVTTTVKAIACASGYNNSSIASAVYTYSGSGGLTATPTFSPTGGSYTSTQFVSLADTTSGAVIYYTTDGTTPTTASNVYSVPLAVSATATIKAMAVAPGLTNSSVASATYTITSTLMLATPTFSPGAGNYPSAQTVTLTCASGATCYYTTDGSTPTTSSTVYSAPISVGVSATLKAIAVETGFTNSPVGVAAYTIGCGLTPYATGNIDITQIRAGARQGVGLQAQMAYGGFITSDLPIFNCNGDLVDSGNGISSFATRAAVQQQSYTYAADTGTANAYAVTLSPAPTIAAGSYVAFKAANVNTGASTLAVNGGTATAIKKNGSTALASGDIPAGGIELVENDGTNWQLLNPATAATCVGCTIYFGRGFASATSGNNLVTLGSTPLANSLSIFVNGSILSPGAYSLSGSVATLTSALSTGNVVVADWATSNSTPGSITVSGGISGLAAWPMNEGSGLALNDHGTSSDNATLSASGAVTWQSNAGFPGTSTKWNGSGNALASSTTLTNFDGTAPFSVAVWMRYVSGSEQALLSTLNASAGTYQGWELQIGGFSSNKVVFFLVNTYPSNGIAVEFSTNVADGNLHYLTVTYDGSKTAAGVKGYVDGSLQTNAVQENNLTSTTANGLALRFGARNNGSDEYLGVMGFAEVWNSVLTSTQVSTFYAAGPQLN